MAQQRSAKGRSRSSTSRSEKAAKAVKAATAAKAVKDGKAAKPPKRAKAPKKKKSRFRLGALLGLAAGYVLGAKAGRARYEQIQSWARRLTRSEPAQQLGDEARMAASRAGEALEHKASEGVSRITDRVRRGSESDPAVP